MTEAVIVALIAGVCSVIGQGVIAWKGRRNDAAERARLDERTGLRLQAIEHELAELKVQVREHNGLKQDIAALRADVQNLKER